MKFSNILGQDYKQANVFPCIKDNIEDFINGKNNTIFA